MHKSGQGLILYVLSVNIYCIYICLVLNEPDAFGLIGTGSAKNGIRGSITQVFRRGCYNAIPGFLRTQHCVYIFQRLGFKYLNERPRSTLNTRQLSFPKSGRRFQKLCTRWPQPHPRGAFPKATMRIYIFIFFTSLIRGCVKCRAVRWGKH